MNRKEWKDRLKKMDIILFGAGYYAKLFFRDFSGDYNIVGCITNNPNEMFLSIDGNEVCPIGRVKKAIEAINGHCYIICASAKASEMEEQLWSLGLVPGKNYCSSDMFRLIVSEKQIAVSFGVCYMRAIHDCLRKSSSFIKDYEVFYSLSYLKRNAAEDFFLKFIVSICDLYIYNITLSPVERRKQEEILRYLSSKAKTISIPVISAGAYYPQAGNMDSWSNPYGIVSSKTRWGSFTSPDHNINSMLECGLVTEEIVKSVSDIHYYDKLQLENIYEKDIRGIELAESIADIKISDFIKKNRGVKRLFINESHISNEVMIELTRRIMMKLGYSDDLPSEELLTMQLVNTTEVPIYPSVIEGLDLEVYKNEPMYRLFTFKGIKMVTFEEYVRLYCDYCNNMMRYLNDGFFPDTRRQV